MNKEVKREMARQLIAKTGITPDSHDGAIPPDFTAEIRCGGGCMYEYNCNAQLYGYHPKEGVVEFDEVIGTRDESPNSSGVKHGKPLHELPLAKECVVFLFFDYFKYSDDNRREESKTATLFNAPDWEAFEKKQQQEAQAKLDAILKKV